MFETLFPALSPDEPQEAEDTEKVAPAKDTAKEEAADKQPAEDKGEGEKPALILGKFKTQEEFEKAYKELERTFGKKSTEAAQLRKELEQRTPAKAEEKDPLEEVLKDPDKWMERLYKEGPKAVLELVDKVVDKRTKPLEERVATNSYQEQVRQFREEHDDLDEYAEDMAEWIKEHPKLAKEPDALEMAYKSAKYDRLSESLPKLAEGAVKAKAKADADKAAARMPGGGRQQTKEPTPEEAMRAALLGEDKKSGIFG